MAVEERKCGWCGEPLPSGKGPLAKYCTYECRQFACRSAECSGCGKVVYRGHTSADVQFCLDCRRAARATPEHGVYGYRKGCRCEECRRATTEKMRAYVERYRVEHGVHPTTEFHKRQGWDRHANLPAWISPVRRYAIYNRDDWTCGLCGGPVDREWSRKSPTAPTLDHIVPRSQGGAHDESNLTTAHARCNALRRDQDFTTFIIAAALGEVPLLVAA